MAFMTLDDIPPDEIYVLDTETTGLYGAPKDLVVDVGITRVSLRKGTVEDAYSSVLGYDVDEWDNYHRNAWIFQNTDMTLDMVAEAPPAMKVIEDVRHLLRNKHVTSYNVAYDMDKFLYQEPWSLRGTFKPCFDIMIVAGTAAFDFNNLRGLWLPLVLICAAGAAVTFFFVLRCCRKLYPNYLYEGFFSMFGMLTGTASNGMILLREIDPRFETPAANNLVLQTIPALAFGFPVLLLMGFAPQSMQNTLITICIMIGALFLFCLFIFRSKKSKATTLKESRQ